MRSGDARTPEFSVVLPSRGDSPHLRAALRSALASNLDVELLLVHDRRPGEPRLPRVLSEDRRVHVVESREPGPAAGRNTGIDVASGRYLGFLDDDDLWLPGHLQAARDVLESRPEALLVASDAYRFEDTSQAGEGVPPENLDALARFRADAGIRELTRRDLLLANPILTPTVVLRRNMLGKTKRFRNELPVMEDYELWLRLVQCHVLLLDGRATVVVRKRPSSASRDLRGMAERSIDILDAHLGPERGGPLTARERRERLGRLWHDLAYACLIEDDPSGARKAATRSALHLPLLGKNYIYTLVSLLPAPLRRAMASARRRHGELRASRSPANGRGAR